MSCIEEQQLGQRRDNDTDTHTVYTVPSGKSVRITNIILCNTSTVSAKIRVFKSTGITYDQSTAIVYDPDVPANSTIEIDGNKYLQSGGTIGYQQGTANAVTITVDGLEITL